MKCPNPECENTALEKDCAFCLKCGCNILKAKEGLSSPSSPSVDDNNKTSATNEEDSEDGGQRKRKDDGELEEKQSKRKSVGNEDCPVPGGDGRVDVPASALQKLQLAIDPPEVQQNTAPVKTSTLPDVGSACESDNLLGASSSSSPDVNRQQNQEHKVVRVRKENESEASAGSTATSQSKEDETGDSDSGSDSEEDEGYKPKDDTRRSAGKPLGTSKKKRNKKKGRKKRKEAELKEANQQKKVQDAINDQGSEKQKGGIATEQEHDNAIDQINVKEKRYQEKNCHEDSHEEYFAKDQGKKMTVVFHAVLAPHFKYEETEGDRIFMRFGGVAFGDFNDNVVEVHPEKYLENDFILVQARLRVPTAYVSGKIPYKYIVFKAKSREEDKYVWGHLVGWRPKQNRCLQIPQERCQTEEFWHQYDDTIFSPPNWFQNFRNKVPIVKSMDPVEGRNIATWAMLPRWEGFTVDKMDTSMTAWEAVKIVNDIAYCMTQTRAQEGRHHWRNVPEGYSFSTVRNCLLCELFTIVI